MKKMLVNFAEKYNLTCERNVAYGRMRGYQVGVLDNTPYQTYFLIFSHLNDTDSSKINNYLTEHKKEFKLSVFRLSDCGISFAVNGLTVKKMYEKMEEVALTLIDYIRDFAPNDCFCPMTGKQLDYSVTATLEGGMKVFVDPEWKVEAQNEIEKEEENFENAPNNYLRGTIGAAIGALIGSVVWLIVGMFGLISGWIAFLIAFLASKGYDIAKGKPTKKKILIVSLITLLFVILSMFVLYVVIVMASMAAEGIDGNPVITLFQLLNINTELRAEFIKDMVVSVLFAGFGIWLGYYQIKKGLHTKKSI